MSEEPHAHSLKALAIAHASPRCGARCRRNGGAPCRAPAIKGKARCRMHGGKSSGPSPAGRETLAGLRWKHGLRSSASISARADAANIIRGIAEAISQTQPQAPVKCRNNA